ncbi:MAG: type I phosphomannose isomerase catalytic subunit, partial [bacterium]
MADHHNLPDFLVLNSTVQHYNWGGEEFIPSLLGIDNEEKRPYAELWMGAHPKSPSVTEINGQEFPLDKLFEIHASELMGKKAAEKFDNRLPFLLKVLDVNKMLSIQVHPTIAQAEIGFARENSLGIPLS